MRLPSEQLTRPYFFYSLEERVVYLTINMKNSNQRLGETPLGKGLKDPSIT